MQGEHATIGSSQASSPHGSEAALEQQCEENVVSSALDYATELAAFLQPPVEEHLEETESFDGEPPETANQRVTPPGGPPDSDATPTQRAVDPPIPREDNAEKFLSSTLDCIIELAGFHAQRQPAPNPAASTEEDEEEEEGEGIETEADFLASTLDYVCDLAQYVPQNAAVPMSTEALENPPLRAVEPPWPQPHSRAARPHTPPASVLADALGVASRAVGTPSPRAPPGTDDPYTDAAL
jgi:hypothetical protein